MNEPIMYLMRGTQVGGQTIEIPAPTFGYTTQIIMAINIDRAIGRVDAFDRGIQYDKRTCEFSVRLREEDVAPLKELLRRGSNRSDKFVLALPENSGFFPAGPDMGDYGAFKVSLVDGYPKFSSMRVELGWRFKAQFAFMFHDLPMPPVLKEPPEVWAGAWRFGTVEGLRDPERDPVQEYAIKRVISAGGESSYTSRPTDEFLTTLTQKTTTRKMAELVSYLQRTRFHTINIEAGKNQWPFGIDRPASGEINVRYTDNTINLAHENVDTWKTSLKLWCADGMFVEGGGGI